MGVDEAKLNLMYVKAQPYNVHHMVMTYYSKPGAVPLVLDNLVTAVKPASQRTDLMPIFSFNGTGLWLAKQRGRGKLAGSSNAADAVHRLSCRVNSRANIECPWTSLDTGPCGEAFPVRKGL